MVSDVDLAVTLVINTSIGASVRQIKGKRSRTYERKSMRKRSRRLGDVAMGVRPGSSMHAAGFCTLRVTYQSNKILLLGHMENIVTKSKLPPT